MCEILEEIFIISIIFIPFIIFFIWLINSIVSNKNRKKELPTQKQLTNRQKIFKNFLPETQWTIIKPFLDIFNSSVSNKMATLPSLSAIAVMMIIIATLKSELIPISLIYTKIIISILLFLIPYCLFIYLWDVQDGAERALKYYEEYTGDDPKKEFDSDFRAYIKGSSPIFIACIYTAIVIFLLEIIWGIF